MEHCVFAHTLSEGKDFRDCGRPCETHAVDLKDTLGKPHPLIPDAGCRNTLYNGEAQSALSYLPKMKELGIRHFRVELLRETGDDVERVIREYRHVIDGSRATRCGRSASSRSSGSRRGRLIASDGSSASFHD